MEGLPGRASAEDCSDGHADFGTGVALVANADRTGTYAPCQFFWPLSLVGLIIVGVLVLRARRLPAPIRYLPLLASLYIPVEIAVSWAPDTVRGVISALYLALAYGLLGAMIMRDAVRLCGLQPSANPAEELSPR
jgi:hypothetical protein